MKLTTFLREHLAENGIHGREPDGVDDSTVGPGRIELCDDWLEGLGVVNDLGWTEEDTVSALRKEEVVMTV